MNEAKVLTEAREAEKLPEASCHGSNWKSYNPAGKMGERSQRESVAAEWLSIGGGFVSQYIQNQGAPVQRGPSSISKGSSGFSDGRCSRFCRREKRPRNGGYGIVGF